MPTCIVQRKYVVIALATLLSIATISYAGIAHAQSTPTFVPLAPAGAQGGQQSGQLTNLYSTSGNGDLTNFINSLFKFAISIGAILAVLRIAYAGYLYMGSADMWGKKNEAKEILGDVTFGLLLLLSIYLILYQINPDIVKLNALKRITPVQNTQGGSSGGTNQSGTTNTSANTNTSADNSGVFDFSGAVLP